ncbi:hypothetical protein BGZ83_002426 [Gryganskiella cystojenkinii]|nr:hypothetical protein BGZ83_002426 [Gryganskiella cystojenkinii]
MNYNRGGPGRGGPPGGMQNKPRVGGGPGGMNFGNDMQQQQQQQFGFQSRNFPQQMIPQQSQPGGPQQPPSQPQQGIPPQQQQQQAQIPQQIQIPSAVQARNFQQGMPSPSLVQTGSMGMMGYQAAGSSVVSANGQRLPFGPPIGPSDQGQKSHHDILRKHQEEYTLKQNGHTAMTLAHNSTPGTYIGMSSKHNNSVIPVLPRLPVP